MPKEFQYLSKRRKNQIIKRELTYYKYSKLLHSTNSNIASDTIEAENSGNSSFTNVDDTFNEINILPHDFANEISESSVESLSDIESNKEHNVEAQDYISDINNISDGSNNITSLREDLQKFIIERNIAHNTVNELLTILRKHGYVDLPKDVRVLLKTPRNASVNIKSLDSGRYVHFGLFSTLKRSIQIYSEFITGNKIKLNINIDGLPISKSSGSQFWPIMASIEDVDTYTLPFIIGIYHGMCKPNNANEFLLDFVNDFILLSQTGIIVSNIKYTVTLNAILCDAPAKSFITYTKGHTGYSSCSKCIQEGDFICNRVVFRETNSMLRTNDTFKNRIHVEHHTGNPILEKLGIGMVSQIPLDYMHLVCLGVVKRLLQLWVRGNRNIRLSKEAVNSVLRYLIALKPFIPAEFVRKPRSLDDIDKWKATEFRQFLLYTGFVVMKSILPTNCYNHFLSLSVGIRILTDQQLCVPFNAYANSLLFYFVSNYGNIYGDEYLSHNVHNLLHLSNDVQSFGSLDNFSCFKFENQMQKIKKKLHQSGAPLEEFSNRTFEELQLPIRSCKFQQYPIVFYKKNHDISHVQFKNFKIATNQADNCAILYDKSVIFILDIFEENCVCYIRAKRFLNPKSFFCVPCSSERLGIFIISNTTNADIIKISVTQIKRKCFKIKCFDEIGCYVTIPLQATNN
ncbi:uncharacterized protein [Linepithema humile]|uniref:uncharacterized protein isoform X1 n=1 Tax=Linepithema humile TaxID=83485 RepID=UPI00351F58A5